MVNIIIILRHLGFWQHCCWILKSFVVWYRVYW